MATSKFQKAQKQAAKNLDERYYAALENMMDDMAEADKRSMEDEAYPADLHAIRRRYNFGVPGNGIVNDALDKFDIAR